MQINDTDGDVTLFVIKATSDVIKKWSDSMSQDSWVSKVLSIFQKYIQKENNSGSIKKELRKEQDVLLPNDSSTLFQIISTVCESKPP